MYCQNEFEVATIVKHMLFFIYEMLTMLWKVNTSTNILPGNFLQLHHFFPSPSFWPYICVGVNNVVVEGQRTRTTFLHVLQKT